MPDHGHTIATYDRSTYAFRSTCIGDSLFPFNWFSLAVPTKIAACRSRLTSEKKIHPPFGELYLAGDPGDAANTRFPVFARLHFARIAAMMEYAEIYG